MTYAVLEQAIKANPRKKGIKLYRIIRMDDRRWIWARTSQEALAKAAHDIGIAVTRYNEPVKGD